MKLFGSEVILFLYDLILVFSRVQDLSVLVVAVLINFSVKKQVQKISLKISAGDLMLVFSYDFDDIIFWGSLVIFETISDYGAQAFSLHIPRASLPIYLITCSSPHRTSKDGDILHSPRHLLLTLGADFMPHGFLLKDEIYQVIWCFSHVFNSQ